MTSSLWWLPAWQHLFIQLGVDVVYANQQARGVRMKRLDVQPGLVNARMTTREEGEVSVELRLSPLREEQWQQLIVALANEALFAAQLLSGQLPQEIEAIFAQVGASLIPTVASQACLSVNPSLSNSTRFVAALYDALTEMVRSDPWLLFLLRGRERESILEALREARRTAPQSIAGKVLSGFEPGGQGYFYHPATLDPAHFEAIPLDREVDHFWGRSHQLRGLQHHLASPPVEFALMRRLGALSPAAEWQAFHSQLATLYHQVTQEALALAYAVDPQNGGSEGEERVAK